MEHDKSKEPRLNVVVNGKPHAIEPGTSLLALLDSMGIPSEGTAVELSGEIVARDKYSQIILADGQHMEIVRMVGGG